MVDINLLEQHAFSESYKNKGATKWNIMVAIHLGGTGFKFWSSTGYSDRFFMIFLSASIHIMG
jgi:hypothetical protein